MYITTKSTTEGDINESLFPTNQPKIIGKKLTFQKNKHNFQENGVSTTDPIHFKVEATDPNHKMNLEISRSNKRTKRSRSIKSKRKRFNQEL